MKNKKIKNRKQDQDVSKKNREIVALFFALAFFFSACVFIFPTKSGILGRIFSSAMLNILGTASYLVSLLFLRYFIMHVEQSSVKYKKKDHFIWSVVFIVSAAVLFEAIHFVFMIRVSGGWIGDRSYAFFKELFGSWFCLGAVAIMFFFSAVRISKHSLISYMCNFLRKLIASFVKLRKNRVQNVEQKNETRFVLRQEFSSKMPRSVFITPNIISKHEKEEDEKSCNFVRMIPNREKASKEVLNYRLPSIDFLSIDSTTNFDVNKNDFFKTAKLLRKTLADFGINAEVKDIIPGPVVTRYDLVLAPGIRIQALSNIIDNISLVMRSASIRIIPVPEKAAVGIEVPNLSSARVGLREILGSNAFKNSKSLVTLALGKTTDGVGYVADLASMPHLLIAGATGSGKSVGIHSIILSILYKARPDEVKFMLIDPKRVEMLIYKDLPHIYNPCTYAVNADVITSPKEAAKALKNLVVLMEERYTKFAKDMVRNIEEYNSKMVSIGDKKEFYIIVIIDEFADLMLMAQKEVEDSVQRLAQMARAVGIHLVLATQRPSVNVITGIIKANFPARLSFQTTSKIDSRVILDMLGAECLIGKGDMLFLPPGEAKPIRLQGAYVSLREAERIVSFINDQKFPRIYKPIVIKFRDKNSFDENERGDKGEKDLISALKLVNERGRVSQDLLKANFGSSARATNILSILEIKGFITKPDGTNKWQINYDRIRNYFKSKVIDKTGKG
ncbi:MAG: DNA translocase FtsK [Endomicrobium sp.]|nr:DNA translocase FtsK [Endomicrobium sp.]